MSGKYALIIGNTDYTDPGLAKLSAPGKDAQAFAHVLESKDICAFDNVQVMLNEPEPSVREAIDAFFDEKKPDDLLVLYFSGHGVRDEYGSLYLALKNTNRLRLRSTAIESDFIRKSMDQSRSKRQVLILDCCNSGAFAQGTKGVAGVSIGTASAFEGTGYGRVVLTASDSTQFAWEGDKIIGDTQNSLFTYFLVKGLQGEADRDGDGRITIDELYDYAYEQIVNSTPKQTPGKWSYKQQGEIVLRQSSRPEDVKPGKLPDDLLDEADDTRPYVREAAVQKLAKILQGRNRGMARSAKEALERIAQDENTTRRVVQAATEALEAYRRAPEASSAEQISESAGQPVVAEQKDRVKEAAAKLRAREVTQQLAARDAKQAVRTAAAKERSVARVLWRKFGIVGIALMTVAVLGYAATQFVVPYVVSSLATPTPNNGPALTQTAAQLGITGPISLNADGSVESIAFSPDGRMLVSGTDNHDLILWDTASHQPIGGPMPGHKDQVNSVAFSPDGKLLASGSSDNTILLWDVATRLPTGAPLTGHTDRVTSVAFSPDGKILASGSADATVRLWDVDTRQPIGDALKWHTDVVESVAFSPDGMNLASGGDDHTIILWDIATREPIGAPLRQHTDSVRMLAFSPDGKILASASADQSVILWNVETQKPIGKPLQGHSDPVTCLAFSPDGKVLASGSYDGTVGLWDVEKEQAIGQPLKGKLSPVLSVAFAPDGRTLAAGAQDYTILLWNFSSTLGAKSPSQQSTGQLLLRQSAPELTGQ